MKVYCTVHGWVSHEPSLLDEISCSCCLLAVKKEIYSIQAHNSAFSTKVCEFCGGPTPCTRED